MDNRDRLAREQFAYDFSDIFAVVHRLPVNVRTHVVGLKSGDYSIIGLEARVTVERKRLDDLIGMLTRGISDSGIVLDWRSPR